MLKFLEQFLGKNDFDIDAYTAFMQSGARILVYRKSLLLIRNLDGDIEKITKMLLLEISDEFACYKVLSDKMEVDQERTDIEGIASFITSIEAELGENQ